MTNENVTLPLLPLTSGVVLPGMVFTMALESDEARAAVDSARSAGGRLLLVPHIEGRFAAVGVIAEVMEEGDLPGGLPAVAIRGDRRAVIGTGIPGTGDALWVEAEPLAEPEMVSLPGGTFVMGSNLGSALNALFSAPAQIPPPTISQASSAGAQTVTITAATPPPNAKGDLSGASTHYNRALAALRTGDWTQFGNEMQQLGTELGQPADSAHH